MTEDSQKFMQLWWPASAVVIIVNGAAHGFFHGIGLGTVTGLISAACVFKYVNFRKLKGIDVDKEGQVICAVVLSLILMVAFSSKF